MQPAGSHYYLRHQVKPGDTLYSIAWRFGYDYREVAAWNRIPPPYRIYVGQELLILAPDRFNVPAAQAAAPEMQRERAARPAAPVAAPAPAAPKPGPLASAAPKTDKPSQAPKAPARPAANAAPAAERTIRWQWPTEGKIVARFAAGKGRKGIDVSGRLGQPVRAAADGEVVYSGNGLIGYGNLVIVKHDDVFLSAYGHNRRLLVKEGDKIKQGSTLGEMGQGSNGVPILHFEIRKNGKPIDPLLYLPGS
ncbi:MAG: peptidoglycan DD-metalloendopeptidase family protein [Thiohalomonadaceae bacterium]